MEMAGLAQITYYDHVLFRHTNSTLLSPILRVCVGWVVKEDESAVWLLWDMPATHLDEPVSVDDECGLVIRKVDIVQVKSLGP